MHSRILASRMRTNAALVGTPMRFFRKTMNADFYNQRFTPSQGKDNQYVHSAQHVHGANGAPSVSTPSPAMSTLLTCLILLIAQNGERPHEVRVL